MGINYFFSKENQRACHEALIKGYESHIQFLEGVIERNQNMIKLAKTCPRPGDKDILKMYKSQVKEFKEKLKVLKEKLIQEQMKYNERFPETLKEKALKMGFAVIQGGALQ